jgi:hypothetical protein
MVKWQQHQISIMNNYLKRGDGKNKGDVKKYDFFSHYRANAKLERLERKQYSKFLKDLLNVYSESIVTEALELKLNNIGYIRVQAKQLKFIDNEGNLFKGLKPDWKKTWEHWEKKYPNKTRDEIIEISNKKVVYFENNHTNQEFYKHIWDNVTAVLKFKRFYKFKPSRQYSRLIKQVVSDPNRKVFYYG